MHPHPGKNLKKLIHVVGPSNSGKSSSIRRFLHNNRIDVSTKDIRIVIRIGNKVVGVTSYGDDEDAIKKNLQFLEDYNCNYIICASKSGGESLNYLDTWVEKNKVSRVCVPTHRSTNPQASWKKVALQIKRHIK